MHGVHWQSWSSLHCGCLMTDTGLGSRALGKAALHSSQVFQMLGDKSSQTMYLTLTTLRPVAHSAAANWWSSSKYQASVRSEQLLQFCFLLMSCQVLEFQRQFIILFSMIAQFGLSFRLRWLVRQSIFVIFGHPPYFYKLTKNVAQFQT